jgi:phosphoribosylglycinamide formyltransferase 2
LNRVLILGFNETGERLKISAEKFGCEVIEVPGFNMLDAALLRDVITQTNPDMIFPATKSIRMEVLKEFELAGSLIIPNAYAAYVSSTKDLNRQVTHNSFHFSKNIKYDYAYSMEQLSKKAERIGYPVMIKPIISENSNGHTVAHDPGELEAARQHALSFLDLQRPKVMIEEFFDLDNVITQAVVKQTKENFIFLPPVIIGSFNGDSQENIEVLSRIRLMSRTIVEHLEGPGLYSLEFFLVDGKVHMSEVNIGPNKHGIDSMTGQSIDQYDLHVMAALGITIPEIEYYH